MTTTILTCLLIILAIPVCFLSIEVGASIFSLRRKKWMLFEQEEGCVLAEEVKLVVLVPAHDEEVVIESTLKGVREQLRPQDRLLVVADNCSDTTAVVARKMGAEVIERSDATKRGKGYALDFGIQFLRSNPPDVVVIMDADVQVGEGTIPMIARLAYRHQRPVQAKNLLFLTDKPCHRDMLSAFAFLLKNYIRPLGLMHLGGCCLLTGTGMAFAWKNIADVKLASGNIVEDMQLGLDLAIKGSGPLYCPEALVTSEIAPSMRPALTQRARWEHGHFQTIIDKSVRLFREAISQRRLDLALLGLELSVPPLASLALLLGAGCLFSLILYLVGWVPVEILVTFFFLIVLSAISVLSGWMFLGKDILPGQVFLSIPTYILWKIPIYVQLFFIRNVKWTKTTRRIKKNKISKN